MDSAMSINAQNLLSPGFSNTPPLTYDESFGIPRLGTPRFDPMPLSQTISGILGKFMGEGDITCSSFDLSCASELTNIKDITFDWDGYSRNEEGRPIPVVNESKDPTSKELPSLPSDSMSSQESTGSLHLSDFAVLPNSVPPIGNAGKLCVERSTGRVYAIRQLLQSRQIWPELAILETLKSTGAPFSPTLHCSFEEDHYVYLVMEHYCGGTLTEVIERNGAFNSIQIFSYACEIISGLRSLHQLGIIHRNISPDTILFDSYDHIVLSGLERATLANSDRKYPVFTAQQGSYQAPELLLCWDHDLRVDSWSFGLVMCYMIHGEHLLQSPHSNGKSSDLGDHRNAAIYNGVSCELLLSANVTAKDLILKCLERNPAMRYTSLEIQKHPFFSAADWQKINSKKIQVPKLHNARTSFHDCSNVGTDHVLIGVSNDLAEEKYSCSQTTRSRAFFERVFPRLSGSLTITERSRNDSNFQDTSIAKHRRRKHIINTEEPAVGLLSTSDGPGSVLSAPGPVACSQSLGAQDKTAAFWESLDREAHKPTLFSDCSRFANIKIPDLQAWKLRGRHALIRLRHLFSLTAANFPRVLRRQEKSIAALKHEAYAEPISELPTGLYQLGSGIGYAYRTTSSRTSVSTTVPRACHSLWRCLHIPGSLSGPKTMGLSVSTIVKKARVEVESIEEVSLVTLSPQVIDRKQTGDNVVSLSFSLTQSPQYLRGTHSPCEASAANKDDMITFLAEDIEDWESLEKIYLTECELDPESTVRLVKPSAGLRFS